jgi:hypothetical protein
MRRRASPMRAWLETAGMSGSSCGESPALVAALVGDACFYIADGANGRCRHRGVIQVSLDEAACQVLAYAAQFKRQRLTAGALLRQSRLRSVRDSKR